MGIFTAVQVDEHVKSLPEYMWSMFDIFIPMVVPTYTLVEVDIMSNDMIVLCTDGISDYIKPEEIKELLRLNNLAESITKIIGVAKEKSLKASQRYDDLTVVVYSH